MAYATVPAPIAAPLSQIREPFARTWIRVWISLGSARKTSLTRVASSRFVTGGGTVGANMSSSGVVLRAISS